MAIVINQDIPSDEYDEYIKSYAVACPTGYNFWTGTYYSQVSIVRKRYPFHMHLYSGFFGLKVSNNQRTVRFAFKDSANCFANQTPYDRSIWFALTPSGFNFYYDYFMYCTLPYFLRNEIPPWIFGLTGV